jgi:hypothetical protein
VTELVLRDPDLPDVATARAAMARYQELCEAVLEPTDWQAAGDDRRFVKKSGWTKLAKAYGVSIAFVRETDLERDHDGRLVRASARVRATAPDGRSWESGGAAALGERRHTKPEHDLPSTAETRAANRAISNLIGFGEVSAEEVDADPPPAAAPVELAMLDMEGESQVAATLQKVWPHVDAYGFMLELERRLDLGGVPIVAGRALRRWAWWQSQPQATGSIRAQDEEPGRHPNAEDPPEATVVDDRPGADYRPAPTQEPLTPPAARTDAPTLPDDDIPNF